MEPASVDFGSTYIGMQQQRGLVAKSTFDVPITVKKIISNDMRLMPFLHQPVVLRPQNRTEFVTLTLDASQKQLLPLSAQPQAFKEGELANFLQSALGNVDPMLYQNLI